MRLVVQVFLVLTASVFVLAFSPTSIHAASETYIVQPGDTLFAIATRYHTTVAAIKQLNKLDSDTILVGQKLVIPTVDVPTSPSAAVPKSSAYIVQAGDSLLQIALRYGVTMRELMQLNDLPNANLIYAGQALAIPNNTAVAKPGLILDPPSAGQGSTVLIRVARPNLIAINAAFSGKSSSFTRAAGYWYALIGVSRCAKIGNAPITLTLTDANGQATIETANLNIASTAFIVQAINLPPAVSGILSNQDLVKREADQLAAIVNRPTPARLWNGAFRQPIIAPISSAFGSRRSYNGGAVGACGHEGTDFSASTGAPIYAPARGQVVFAGLTQVRGNLTVIDHGLGVFTAYYHQSEISVSVGQMIEAGTLIGKVGSTGLSTGPHLHWSMWVNGEYVDPMEWTRRALP